MLLRSNKDLVKIMLTLAAVAPFAVAHADDDGAAKHHKKGMVQEASGAGYGVAGCGLGSLVFGAQPGMIQIVSSTLNGTGYQTFGITTGTSNCDIPQMGFQAAAFIETNHEVVATELARGQGETVTGLASILKCSDAELLGQKLRENYGTILENGISSFETTRRIMKTIQATPDLKTTCQSENIG